MTSPYHSHRRTEIEPLLPATATRILDIGCGIGATAAWLKTRYPGSHTIGLEGNPTLLDQLARNVDQPCIVDLNGPLPALPAVDLVLMLDILEHLLDPGDVLRRVIALMTDDATAIVSLPNIAYLKIGWRLLLRGRFDYVDAGILDRTHLHFYYRGSALDLLKSAGLRIERGLPLGLDGPRTRWADRLTLGLLQNRLAKGFLFAARRGGGEPVSK